MVLLLKLFEYDPIKNEYYKLNNYYEFPFELDLNLLNKEDSYIIDDNYKYYIKRIIIHYGKAYFGHYYAIIKDNNKGIWTK